MKNLFVVLLSGSFLFFGLLNVIRQIKNTEALNEIVRFIGLVKTEVRYRTAEYNELYSKGKAQNYKYLSFSEGEIFVNKAVGDELAEDFKGFINRIGTTDEEGQITICDEYKERFEELLKSRKSKEREKLQVNTALSIFGALTVLIFFL